MLKFKIAAISADGQVLSRTFDGGEVAELLGPGDDGMVFDGAVVDLTLLRAGEAVLVNGTVQGSWRVPCGRCAELAEIALECERLSFTYLPPSAAGVDGEEVELSFEDLDTACHDGEFVDLGPLVREQFMLATPIAPLCKVDCAGLCAHCGANRNFVDCDCGPVADTAEQKSSWQEALESLKKENLS